MVTVVKQILSERARPECRLLFSSARSLSHIVPHQYTRLHINLTEDQPNEVRATSYTIAFGLSGKFILHIIY